MGDASDDFDDDDVCDDSESVDLDAVAANLQHTAAARQLASKLKPRKIRPVALLAVAEQADENVFEYADDIGWVEPPSSRPSSTRSTKSLDVRSAMIGALISAAPKQAESARGKSLKTIADLLSDGDPEVLLDTLAEEDGYGATPEVKQTVVPVLAGMLDDADKSAVRHPRPWFLAAWQRAARSRVMPLERSSPSSTTSPTTSTSSSPTWRTTTIPPPAWPPSAATWPGCRCLPPTPAAEPARSDIASRAT